MNKVGFARKALIGGLAALLASLANALSDGELTVPEIAVALLFTGGGLLAVYQVPNDDDSGSE